MGILKDRIFLIIIFLGVFFRILFINTPGFKFDVDVWLAWSERLNQLGFAPFYTENIWTHYTPGYLYVLYFLGLIKNLFHLDHTSFYLILKLPSIIAEIFLGIFIYQQILEKSKPFAKIAGALVLLNPAFIFNSAIWGQIDGFLSLFMVLTIYFFTKQNWILSALCFGFAFLIKPQAIALLPVLMLYFAKHWSWKNIVRFFPPFALIVFILSLPFFITQPLTGLANLLTKMVKDYPYNSLNAYNFWGIFGFWIGDTQRLAGVSLKTWGILLYIAYWIPITYLYFKGKLSIYSLAVLACLSFFFLPTRVHERYFYSALIFLIILTASSKSRILLIFTTLLGFIHFLNLHYVYSYYNQIYLSPLYNLLKSNDKTLSFISTVLFIFISAYILTKSKHVSENINS